MSHLPFTPTLFTLLSDIVKLPPTLVFEEIATLLFEWGACSFGGIFQGGRIFSWIPLTLFAIIQGIGIPHKGPEIFLISARGDLCFYLAILCKHPFFGSILVPKPHLKYRNEKRTFERNENCWVPSKVTPFCNAQNIPITHCFTSNNASRDDDALLKINHNKIK